MAAFMRLDRWLPIGPLLLLLLSAALSDAARDECDGYFAQVDKSVPALPREIWDWSYSPYLVAFELRTCQMSFDTREAAWSHHRSCYHTAVLSVHQCPRDCLLAQQQDPPARACMARTRTPARAPSAWQPSTPA